MNLSFHDCLYTIPIPGINLAQERLAIRTPEVQHTDAADDMASEGSSEATSTLSTWELFPGFDRLIVGMVKVAIVWLFEEDETKKVKENEVLSPTGERHSVPPLALFRDIRGNSELELKNRDF